MVFAFIYKYFDGINWITTTFRWICLIIVLKSHLTELCLEILCIAIFQPQISTGPPISGENLVFLVYRSYLLYAQQSMQGVEPFRIRIVNLCNLHDQSTPDSSHHHLCVLKNPMNGNSLVKSEQLRNFETKIGQYLYTLCTNVHIIRIECQRGKTL